MEITRVLNTNAVVTLDSQMCEIIVTGAGIGFRKKKGEMLDEALIDKTYRLHSREDSRRLQEFVEAVSEQYLDIAQKAIDYARNEQKLDIKDLLYVTLTDHINSAVERRREGIILPNALTLDIERFYPKEFRIGEKTVAWVAKKTGLDLGKDEAAFIAMHIVASETNQSSVADVGRITELITAVVQIVRLHFKLNLREDSFAYQRFVTHLKFFAGRVFEQFSYKDTMEDIFKTVAEQNPDIYKCVLKIKEFIKKQYKYEIDNNELLYLMIYVRRIIDEEKEIEA